LIRQEETDSGPASAAPSLGQVDILEGSLARSPENLVGIGETGGGMQNSEDDRDWSFEFWFLIFLEQQRNDNGLSGLLHGCARPLAPSSVPLLEMSSKRNFSNLVCIHVFFRMLILVWKCRQRVGATLYPYD
jgi:hypothetical protein